MNPKRIALAAALAAVGAFVAADLPAAPASPPSRIASSGPRHPGAAPGHRGNFRPSHPGSHRPGQNWHWDGRHQDRSNWGWGLGLSLGLPWALGWHDPFWWGPSYYPSYAYGPVYRSYGYVCEQDEDCRREREAQLEPAPPTTEVAPALPAEEGGPTQRPLHLNYCDSAQAWFPQVRTCPGGWRLVLPDYAPAQ